MDEIDVGIEVIYKLGLIENSLNAIDRSLFGILTFAAILAVVQSLRLLAGK